LKPPPSPPPSHQISFINTPLISNKGHVELYTYLLVSRVLIIFIVRYFESEDGRSDVACALTPTPESDSDNAVGPNDSPAQAAEGASPPVPLPSMPYTKKMIQIVRDVIYFYSVYFCFGHTKLCRIPRNVSPIVFKSVHLVVNIVPSTFNQRVFLCSQVNSYNSQLPSSTADYSTASEYTPAAGQCDYAVGNLVGLFLFSSRTYLNSRRVSYLHRIFSLIFHFRVGIYATR